MKVKVEPREFELGSNVTGPIWVEVDGTAFPAPHWNDFPVIILGWWLMALRDLSEGGIDRAQCYFMDGPYHLEIVTSTHGATVSCFRGSVLLGVSQLDGLANLLASVVESAKGVFSVCTDRRWTSADLDELSKAIAYFSK